MNLDIRGELLIANKQVTAINYSNLYPHIFLKVFKVDLCLAPKTASETAVKASSPFNMTDSIRAIYSINFRRKVVWKGLI
jgi:hypothetical protein